MSSSVTGWLPPEVGSSGIPLRIVCLASVVVDCNAVRASVDNTRPMLVCSCFYARAGDGKNVIVYIQCDAHGEFS